MGSMHLQKVHFADIKTMKGLQHEAIHRARSSQVSLSTSVGVRLPKGYMYRCLIAAVQAQ